MPYDYDNDPNQIDTLAPIAREIAGTLPPKPSGVTQMERVEGCLRDALAHLQKSIEENRLSDVLYDDAGKPRKEMSLSDSFTRSLKSLPKFTTLMCRAKGTPGRAL